jgi:hypothetical protein
VYNNNNNNKIIIIIMIAVPGFGCCSDLLHGAGTAQLDRHVNDADVTATNILFQACVVIDDMSHRIPRSFVIFNLEKKRVNHFEKYLTPQSLILQETVRI